MRRALSVVVAMLCAGTVFAEPPAELRKRLHDPSPMVRKQAALTLAEAHDADAIPVLIDLLGELSGDDRKPIEEYLTELAGESLPASSGKDRRDAWKKWWRDHEGNALLGIIRKHVPTPEVRRKVKALIEQLGNDEFKTRESADKELRRLGRVALPQLRQAKSDPDAERAQRARRVIERIEGDPKSHLSGAVVRLLALRKPDGATAALLAYLPLAEEDNLGDEVKAALIALALRDGKLDAALLRALDDELPLIRAAAAEALVRGGGRRGRAAVAKLLRKDTPLVRLRIALALVRTGDKDGVSVLIDLLAVLPGEQASEAEEALYQLAGDKPPKLPDDNTKRRDVWAAWWKSNAQR
ncbi:MAG: HEAT repeat domain-containing protein, partial [Gemmataceae bacterium]